jgi:hypothetical protein
MIKFISLLIGFHNARRPQQLNTSALRLGYASSRSHKELLRQPGVIYFLTKAVDLMVRSYEEYANETEN